MYNAYMYCKLLKFYQYEILQMGNLQRLVY